MSSFKQFQDFLVTSDKIAETKVRARKMAIKHFRNAFIMGFLLELMLIKTPIYENTVRKVTMKRLNAKLRE
jgi:hypothetical protein